MPQESCATCECCCSAAYFKDLKKDIRDFLDGWPSAAFDAAHGHRIGGLNLNQGIPLSEFSLCSLLQVRVLSMRHDALQLGTVVAVRSA